MSEERGGYVYIMTNSTMPGIVKIGSTKLTPYRGSRRRSDPASKGSRRAL
jgi:hypothetical protein